MTKQEQIVTQIQNLKQIRKAMEQRSRRYSGLRLASAIISLISAIYADQSKQSFFYILSVLMIVVFAYLVYRHQIWKENIREQDAMIAVKEAMNRRFDDTWKQEESKSVCLDEDVVSYDLDLLGSRSLYDYLCFAHTPFGKTRLRELLQGKDDTHAQIIQRQNAIEELLRQPDFLLLWECGSVRFANESYRFHDEDVDHLITYAQDQTPQFPKFFLFVSAVMSITTILAFLSALMNWISYGYGALLLLCNLIISIIIYAYCQKNLSLMRDLAALLQDYDLLLQRIIEPKFTSSLLKEKQAMMITAHNGIQHMKTLMNALTLRRNVISYVALSALIQLDVWCMLALEHWRKRYGQDLHVCLQAVGEMEALASLSVLAQVKDTWCFPTLIDQDAPYYEIINGFHPLLAESKAVANSISLDHGTWIITGSNMSGKTTFLRTLGISMMLCRAGAPICAEAMKTSVLPIYTSMRVKDDMSEGISTFYAELLRIKTMMEACEKRKPMLVLIDEILKGTNSADRVLCAQTAISKLHQPWVITLVSTHDFALCDCEQDPIIQAHNYHFSEYYEQDEIHFDYRIKKGRCTSTNAKELMRLAGIWKEESSKELGRK